MLRNLFASFTWLEAELLHGCLGSGDGCPGIFQVRLGDAGFALAAGRAVGAEVSFGRGFGAPWAAVGFLNGGNLHVYQENEEAQLLHLLKTNNFVLFLLAGLSR